MAFEPLKLSGENPTPGFVPLGAPVPPRQNGVPPTFKASMGGAGSIIPNVAKTFGNIPSNAGNILDLSLAQPLRNFSQSASLASSIYKDAGFVQGTKDIAGGFASTAKSIFKAPGEFLVGQSDKNEAIRDLAPVQEKTVELRDKLVSTIQKNRKEGKDVSRLVSALAGLTQSELELNSIVGSKEGRVVGQVEGLSNIVKYPIERPLDVPLALYAGPNKQGKDFITRTASPITRGSDTSLQTAMTKVGTKVDDLIGAQRVKAIDGLEDTYVELASGTTPGKKKIDKLTQKTQAQNKSGTEGRTPMRVLAEEGVIPRRKGTKLDTFEQAGEYRENVKPLRDANRLALEEISSTMPPRSLDELEALAIAEARTPKNVDSGRFDGMQREIQKRFNSLRSAYPSGSVPITKVDDIKSGHWDNVFKNKSVVEADALAKDADYAIAKALQRDIERVASEAGHAEVAQLNREIGDRLGAAKFLEELNGKTIKGGRLLKYLTTAIGSAIGQGVVGKIVGAVGGSLVGELIIASNVSSPIKRLLLRNLARKDPEAYAKTIEWLRKQDLDRETRLLLPQGPIILKGPEFKSGVSVAEAQKNPVSVNPQTGRFQTSYNSQSKSPINQQTNPAISNVESTPISTNPTTLGQKSNPLAQEARKYKSAEEFVKAVIEDRGGVGYPNYSPAKRLVEVELNDTPLTNFGYKPTDKVTIYRGVDNASQKDITAGDYIATSYDLAKSYTGGKVISKEVPANTVRFASSDGITASDFAKGFNQAHLEGVYNPDPLIPQSQLTDIWNKANKKKK